MKHFWIESFLLNIFWNLTLLAVLCFSDNEERAEAQGTNLGSSSVGACRSTEDDTDSPGPFGEYHLPHLAVVAVSQSFHFP